MIDDRRTHLIKLVTIVSVDNGITASSYKESCTYHRLSEGLFEPCLTCGHRRGLHV